MKKTFQLWMLLVLPMILSAASPAPEFDSDHTLWTTVLHKNVVKDNVNYAALKKDRAQLDDYVALLSRVSVAEYNGWTREERFAFWINAYNAHTVKLIVDNYPLKSIRDINHKGKDAWHQPLVPLQHLVAKLSTGPLTLDEIENSILRPTFKDPRLHAAVNCAAVSCPPLAAQAFTGKLLNKQLDRQTQAWLKDARRNRFDARDRRARISKIFEWYAADFGGTGKGTANWLAKNAPPEHRGWIAGKGVNIEFMEYDWKLNDTSQ